MLFQKPKQLEVFHQIRYENKATNVADFGYALHGWGWPTGRGTEWWVQGFSAGSAVPEPPQEEGDLTPPAHRRLAKSFSVSASKPRDKQLEKSMCLHIVFILNISRGLRVRIYIS